MSGKCPLHQTDDNLIQSCREYDGYSHVTYSCGCTVETKIPSIGDAVLFQDTLYRVTGIHRDSDIGDYATIENNLDDDEVPLIALEYVAKDTISSLPAPAAVSHKNSFQGYKFKKGDWVKNQFDVCGEVVDVQLDDYYIVEVWDDDTTNFLRYRWHHGQLKLKETKRLSDASDFMPVNGLPTGRDHSRPNDRSHWDEWWGRKDDAKSSSPSNRYVAPPKTGYHNKPTQTRRTTHSVSTAGLIRQEVTKLAENKSTDTSPETSAAPPIKNDPDQPRVRKRRSNW